MSISTPFILRPIATSLIMVAVLLGGLLTYDLLPIASLPEVDLPTISVTCTYPGASPEVVASSVTAPLERQLGQMSGLNQMISNSSSGYSSITLQFTLDTALDVAEQEVQAAINAASGYLPTDLPYPPVYNKVNPADTPIITLALTSETDLLYTVEDYAETRLAQKLSQISGVGLVSVTGGNRPAIRIQVNTRLLASMNLTTDDVMNAISNANVNGAKGYLDGSRISYSINSNDQLQTSSEYAELIISYVNNQPVRIKDVAKVIEGAENIMQAAWYNKKPAIIVNIQRQPGANVIKVADEIKSLLPKLSSTLPPSIKVEVITDRTNTIRASVNDVTFELSLAILLVVLVIFFFLRTFSATIIPSIAVPLSLIGSFSFMYLMGYSLNNLSLMALTIATGFVVDDAIVMIENISRYIEEGEKPFDAAIKGAEQIGFTIISLTISLIAVLIPLYFMENIIGRLFKEFAVTLTISIILSAVISLTLTPMLCSQILKSDDKGLHTKFAKYSEKIVNLITDLYTSFLEKVLNHQKLVLMIAAITFAFTLVLGYFIPKGFFPLQDTGLIQGVSQVTDSTSFAYMEEKQLELGEIVLSDPDVASLSSYIGIDNNNPSINKGRILINLKEKRNSSAVEIIERLNEKLDKVVDAKLYLQPVQDINVADQVSNQPYVLSLIAQDEEELIKGAKKLESRLKEDKHILRNVGLDINDKGLEVFIEVNRDKAASLGISMQDIDDALYNMFGQRQISTIFTQRNQYKVILESLPELKQDIDSLNNVFLVVNNNNVANYVPLSSLVKIKKQEVRLRVTRFNQFSLISLYFDLMPGKSLSQGVSAINDGIADVNLSKKITPSFQGTAKVFEDSSGNQLALILAAVIVVYIILGVLYESYIHPLTILSTLPSACMGALLSLWIFKGELDIIGIIGIVLLIGIVAKNAIMMIDFALEQERNLKKTPREAIFEACKLRFRPIMMTTMAAMLGAVPLVTGLGIGSEIRQPLGISIIGGLIVSQALTLFTTPVIYLAFDRLVKKID